MCNKKEYLENKIKELNEKINTYESIIQKDSNYSIEFKYEINNLLHSCKIIKLYFESELEKC